MLTIGLLYLAAVTLILAFFRACSIRESLDQRADQQADGDGVVSSHNGAVQHD